jgi:hypothetical protein
MQKLRAAALAAIVGIIGQSSLFALFATPARAGDESEQKAVDRAHDFLKSRKRGVDVLSYVHMGAKYGGHIYKETRTVKDGQGNPVKGHFGLVYTFKWEDDGVTDLAFLCDDAGNVYKLQILSTNAVLNQPFSLSNGAIKVLGNLLIEAYKGQMNEAQKKQLEKLVADADAKALLEWSLKFQQAFGM